MTRIWSLFLGALPVASLAGSRQGGAESILDGGTKFRERGEYEGPATGLGNFQGACNHEFSLLVTKPSP